MQGSAFRNIRKSFFSENMGNFFKIELENSRSGNIRTAFFGENIKKAFFEKM